MITNVSEIEEYLYCPRQYYYHKQGIHIDSELLKQGRLYHSKNHNIYLRTNLVKGIIDRIEGDKLVEIKRTKSTTLWKSHKIQLMTYIFLAQENGFKINRGLVRYSNGKEFLVTFNRKDKTYLKKIISKMQLIKEIPDKIDEKNKCIRCSLKEYCQI